MTKIIKKSALKKWSRKCWLKKLREESLTGSKIRSGIYSISYQNSRRPLVQTMNKNQKRSWLLTKSMSSSTKITMATHLTNQSIWEMKQLPISSNLFGPTRTIIRWVSSLLRNLLNFKKLLLSLSPSRKFFRIKSMVWSQP